MKETITKVDYHESDISISFRREYKILFIKVGKLRITLGKKAYFDYHYVNMKYRAFISIQFLFIGFSYQWRNDWRYKLEITTYY